jgi:alkyl sulfatase BDS1-like metallo-beta-lactamase superfamily hydrolase
MGGADAMIEKGRASFAEGEYRWVAEAMNHLVFAQPENQRGRWLQADALEQLGYQAESGPWRNFYLTAARELREGVVGTRTVDTASPDVVAGMSSEMVFDFMAVRLKGIQAAEADLALQIFFTDRDELWVLDLENGVLHARQGAPHPDPDVGLEMTRPDFLRLLSGAVGIPALLAGGRVDLSGNPLALAKFGGLFDRFERGFEIVRP